MAYTPKILLVTGGAGFIGAHYIHWLQQHHPECQVINLDKLTYAGDKKRLDRLPHPEQYQLVEGDIADEALVANVLQEFSVNTIVHFAAESHVDRSITGPQAFVETNVIGTFTLLEEAKKYWLDQKKWDSRQCRFHHISTDEVYGSLGKTDPAFHEKMQYQPNSPYSASKASSDHMVRSYQHTFGLPTTTTNCSNNYGPFQHAEKLIPTVVQACVKGEKIPVYGDGSNIRDWLYVDDHCAAVDAVIRQGKVGEVYNVGGSNELSNLDLIKHITTIMDQHFPDKTPHQNLIDFVTDRKGHDWRYAIDARKIEQSVGWKPQMTLQEGLEKTIAFYLNVKR